MILMSMMLMNMEVMKRIWSLVKYVITPRSKNSVKRRDLPLINCEVKIFLPYHYNFSLGPGVHFPRPNHNKFCHPSLSTHLIFLHFYKASPHLFWNPFTVRDRHQVPPTARYKQRKVFIYNTTPEHTRHTSPRNPDHQRNFFDLRPPNTSKGAWNAKPPFFHHLHVHRNPSRVAFI